MLLKCMCFLQKFGYDDNQMDIEMQIENDVLDHYQIIIARTPPTVIDDGDWA